MPSPFPGMDLYLEEPGLWPDVHFRLIGAISDVLQPQLVPRYYAHLGARVYLEELRHAVYPDLAVLRRPTPLVDSGGGGTLVAPDEPTVFAYELRHREPFIEIRSTGSHEVVTVIEVLSPANKGTGRGREEYRRKQGDVLHSEANLVEIDLLRTGEHTVMVPAGRLRPGLDYGVAVHRGSARGEGELYRFTLRDRLPRVRIPLRAPDPDAVLDLPAAFSQCYEGGVYQLRLDYSQPPAAPLGPEEMVWVDELLRKQGVRA